MVLALRGGSPNVLMLDDRLKDRRFDYDFTSLKAAPKGDSYKRGGVAYTRPYGWKRFAIRVLGKFESDAWLGSANKPGEWAVSYHGTRDSAAKSIADGGYDLGKGKRFLYGKGIYSSPNPAVAEAYAIPFVHGGRRYKVML